MSRFCVSSHPITGRSWRSGHPFRPRTGRLRRVVMVMLLLFFGLVIFGYNFVTDANRVREMAENYLSQLIGGRVAVRSATLSIFEGLRLEDVKVYVDDGKQPDSLLFSAQSFTLKYDPAKIITGQLEAAEIIAQKPHVHLTENVETHEWNFVRLGRSRAKNIQPEPEHPGHPMALPDILLRNARVEISEVRDGNLRPIGYEAMDGHLSPTIEEGAFNFEIQTRGIEGVGPWATGTVSLGSNKVDVQLHGFDLRRDLSPVLPKSVLDFVVRHQTSGTIPLLSVHYEPPPHKDASPVFVIEMKLDHVDFSAQQEDYLSKEDIARRTSLRQSLAMMRPFFRAGGYGLGEASREDAAARGRGHGENPADIDMLATSAADVLKASDITHVSLEPFPTLAPSPVAIAEPPRARRDHLPVAVPRSPADILAALTETAPIELHDGSGLFIFSDAGLELKDVTGIVEHNAFLINGRMIGYRPDAPFNINIRSLDHDTLQIPETPRYFNSLPPLVRDIYSIVHPDGTCTMDMNLHRPTPGSRLFVDGHVDVVDGKFACIFFPYTLREARGRVSFGYDEKARADFVYITGVRGRGMPDGPNRDSYIDVNGEVGPLGPDYPDPQIRINVVAKNVTSEPALINALPPEVRGPLKFFDADKTGNLPQFHGDFNITVLHKNGWAWRWSFDTDLALDDAAGKLVGFPYPVDHLAAEMHVRDGYVDVVNARMKRGDASLRVDGRVSWGPMRPPDAPAIEPKLVSDLRVSVKNLPIDKDLLSAIPPGQALWLKRIGLGGKLDVKGRVFQNLPDAGAHGKTSDSDDVNFDLAMALHDGTLWPADGMFSLSDLFANVHLTPDAIELKDIRAKRAGSDLTGEGAVAWGGGPVQLAMHVKAKSLPLDAPLYQLLPKSGRENWDQIQPQGNVEADLSWRGSFAAGDAPTQPAADAEKDSPSSAHSAAFTTIAQQRAAASPALPLIFSRIQPGFYATLKPQALTCTLKELPLRLDGVKGTITITPEKVTIADMTANHGSATLAVAGTGSMGDRSEWNLTLSGKNLAVDDDFHRAMPPAFLAMLDAVKFHGNVDFDFSKFNYRGAPTAPVASPAVAAAPLAAAKPAAVDVDMEGAITLKDCSLEAGAPMKNIFGKMNLAAAVRDGKLSSLQGDLALPRANLAGRDMTDISFTVNKPADRQELYLQKIRGVLADGQVAGEVKLTYPDEGASRYLLSLVVRNADVETLVKDADKDLRGELTASLSLEGTWDDSAPRRGRGDVIVTGKELYHLPLMLGLFQVTNLSLPIATPFKAGTARYSVEGPRINFERVELKSDNMLMIGTGHLDFKSKQVLMTFTTDNPGGLKVPFLNDLIKNAKGELLKITIKGTIKEPKVEANSFGTVTTTIDEVFKADSKEK